MKKKKERRKKLCGEEWQKHEEVKLQKRKPSQRGEQPRRSPKPRRQGHHQRRKKKMRRLAESEKKRQKAEWQQPWHGYHATRPSPIGLDRARAGSPQAKQQPPHQGTPKHQKQHKGCQRHRGRHHQHHGRPRRPCRDLWHVIWGMGVGMGQLAPLPCRCRCWVVVS